MSSALFQSNEKILHLRSGRTVAYEETGNLSGSIVVLFLHGMFGVGSAHSHIPMAAALQSKGVHYIAPTMPGWGNSSYIEPAEHTTFASQFASDMNEFIHSVANAEESPEMKIYIGGGSFGTVYAQMLYGASYDVFPLGKCIAGLLLIAPLSPPRVHKAYAKTLSWSSWMSLGLPAKYFGKPLYRIAKLTMRNNFDTIQHAERFMRRFIFDKMEEGEKEEFRIWQEAKGVDANVLIRELAEHSVRSVATSWDGFVHTAATYHSDWSFSPPNLDEEHSRPRVQIFASTADPLLSVENSKWLARNYKHAQLELIEGGGHISALFRMDNIWEQFLSVEL